MVSMLSNSGSFYLAACLGLAVALPSQLFAAEVFTGAARVVDGDTLDIGSVRIRLEGIDAPEAKQTCNNARRREWECGRSATDQLERLTKGNEVRCEATASDNYGRHLGTCFVAGHDVNAEMIRQGLAWAFVKYSSTYVTVEQEARRAKRGVFEVVNTAPWEYRAGQWHKSQGTEAAVKPTGSCSIKGNVSTRGEKIYHMPGQRDYGSVKVNERNGEQWFCEESQAQAAGWRKAAR